MLGISETRDLSKIGVVAIGRNEGERLRRCLSSIPHGTATAIYVDSGSTDDSVALASSLGVNTVQLDMSIPFTAARARNEGAKRLIELHPGIDFIQFVDGDCVLASAWLDAALSAFGRNPTLAVVCGRRRETAPEASVYNRLCDMEWNTPIGDTKACGGDALMRAQVFFQVSGFNETLIAGEEPELCLRIRAKGWGVRRIDHEMTAHDANMMRFRQWWQRNLRAGHAYAEGYSLSAGQNERAWEHDIRSTFIWAFVVPAMALAFSVPTYGISLLLLGGYVSLYRRITRHRVERRDAREHAELYARYCVLAKFPQLLGIFRYYGNRILGRKSELIEYKGSIHTTDAG